MSGAQVLAIVLGGGILGALAMSLAWSLGFMAGEKTVSDLWLTAIKADAEVEAVKKQFHVAPKPESLYTPAPLPVPDCKCGGLCPGCAYLTEKKTASCHEAHR